MIFRQTPTRRFRCLHCRKKLDTVSDVDGDEQPKPGNLTICIACGHLMIFGHDMWPRNLTREEQIDVAGNKELLFAQNLLSAFKAWKRKQA